MSLRRGGCKVLISPQRAGFYVNKCEALKGGPGYRHLLILPSNRDAPALTTLDIIIHHTAPLAAGTLGLPTCRKSLPMPSRPEPKVRPLWRMSLALFGLAFTFGPWEMRGQVRPEIYPIETVTLGTEQILSGKTNGQQTWLAGELRIPPGNGRVPAVILVHGSDGLNLSLERWAQELNGIGVAAFLLDSFSGRGITSTVNDQSKLHGLTLMVDAYKALGILIRHPRIAANRIGIMGFSKGAI